MKTLTGYDERIQEENLDSQPPATEEVIGKGQDRVKFTYANGTGESESPSPKGAPKGSWYYDMLPRAATEKPEWRLLGLPEREIFRIHCSHYNYKQKCSWESIKTQQEESGLSKMTVIKANKELVKYGFQTVGKKKNRKGGAHNVYYLPDMITLLSQLEATYIRKLEKEKAKLLQSPPPPEPNQPASARGLSPDSVGINTIPTTLPVSIKTIPRLVKDLDPNYTTELNKVFNNNPPVVVPQETLNRLNLLFPNKNKKIGEIIQAYPNDRIEEKLSLTEERTKQGKNTNPPGFFLDAIENNYETPESARSRLAREREKTEAEARKKRAEEAREKEEGEAKRQKEIEKQIQSIPPADKALWNKTLATLKKDMDPQIFNIFLRETRPYSRTKQKITLWVPGEHYKDFLEENYLPQIKQAWSAISGSPTEVEFVTCENFV